MRTKKMRLEKLAKYRIRQNLQKSYPIYSLFLLPYLFTLKLLVLKETLEVNN